MKMKILFESFKTPEARRAFFARLRKGMSHYVKGAHSASEFFQRRSSGLKYLGYEKKDSKGNPIS